MATQTISTSPTTLTTTPSLISESHEDQDDASYEEALERDASIEAHSSHLLDTSNPIHSFQIQKIYHNLPPIISFPPSLSFTLRPTTSASPTLHTSRLSILHTPFLPPPFTVFAGPAPIQPPHPSKLSHLHPHIHHVDTHPGDTHPTTDLPQSGNESNTNIGADKPVAHISYKGGIKHLQVQISVLKTDGRPQGGDAGQGVKAHEETLTEVSRQGWGRSYQFPLPTGVVLVWKGTKGSPASKDEPESQSAKTSERHSKAATNKTASPPITRAEKKASSGNLRLYAAINPHKCLGLWINKTDINELGELLIFEDWEGEALEVVVLACLAVVLGERVRYRGWFRWEWGVPSLNQNGN